MPVSSIIAGRQRIKTKELSQPVRAKLPLDKIEDSLFELLVGQKPKCLVSAPFSRREALLTPGMTE
jgi:hypothetical protein